MSDLYLILHKVRGEPAFDIAIQVDLEPVSSEKMWIIPTSGHRAFPHKFWSLEGLGQGSDCGFPLFSYQEIPADLPDHYAANETPKPKPVTRQPLTADDFLI